MTGSSLLPSWRQEDCDGQPKTHGEGIVSQRKAGVIIRREDAHHKGNEALIKHSSWSQAIHNLAINAIKLTIVP